MVGESPKVKVTVLTATMEALGQDLTDKTNRPCESRRLKISWPPHGATEATPPRDVILTSKPIRAKWPPADQDSGPDHLHGSSSPMDRSLLFTTAEEHTTGQTPPPTTSSPQEDTPEGVLTCTSGDGNQREPKGQNHCLTQDKGITEEDMEKVKKMDEEEKGKAKKTLEEEELEKAMKIYEADKEEEMENVKKMDEEEEEEMEEDGGLLEEVMVPVKELETLTEMTSPEDQDVSRSSQDVGFWDSEEEDEQKGALSVEEMIKRNRCYEDEEVEEKGDIMT